LYEKEERNKEDDEIRLFGGLFLSSAYSKASVFVNC